LGSEDTAASPHSERLRSWCESRNKTSAKVTGEKKTKKSWVGEDHALRIDGEGDESVGSDLVERVGSISGITQADAGKPRSWGHVNRVPVLVVCIRAHPGKHQLHAAAWPLILTLTPANNPKISAPAMGAGF